MAEDRWQTTEGRRQNQMSNEPKNAGFSLAEVLLAIGVLAVGVLFVAGVFPVSVHLTTVVAEQTIAAIAADEAFAKVKIYANGAGGIDFNSGGVVTNQLKDFNDVLVGVTIDPCEFAYPSIDMPMEEKHYCWTALCRRVAPDPNRLVQVTVFVCRKVSPNLLYPDPAGSDTVDRPMPVKVGVSGTAGDNELTITGDKRFINDGYMIVDDKTGQIYRVLERYADDTSTPTIEEDAIVLLDRNWEGGLPGNVWVVPPPVGGGRGPCVGVYQKVIRF